MSRYEGSKIDYRMPARALMLHADYYVYLSECDRSSQVRLRQVFAFRDLLDRWAHGSSGSMRVVGEKSFLLPGREILLRLSPNAAAAPPGATCNRLLQAFWASPSGP
jgi:hypothetical protein